MKHLSADALSHFLFYTDEAFSINWDTCVAQCYDVASVMSGRAPGVRSRLRGGPHAITDMLIDEILYY